jgi:hypothetical protein
MKETAAPAAVADLPIDPALPRTSTAPRTKPGPRPNWICGFGRSLKVGRTAALRNASRGAPTRRNARIKLAMVLREKFGRYGDPAAPAPYGVETVAREFYTPEHMEHMGGRASRMVTWIVPSERKVWLIGRAQHDQRSSIADRTQSDTPWTRVNNCTAATAAKMAPLPQLAGRAREAHRESVPKGVPCDARSKTSPAAAVALGENRFVNSDSFEPAELKRSMTSSYFSTTASLNATVMENGRRTVSGWESQLG